MRKYFLITVIAGILFMNPLHSHHALEFIQIESYHTARRGGFVFHLHYDYMSENALNPNLDHWEFTPGLSYGITNRLMVDLHTHYAKFGVDHLLESKKTRYLPIGPSPFMEAMALSLQYRLTQDWPVNIALAMIYELPFSRSRNLLNGKQVFEGNLIINWQLRNHLNITANLIAGIDGDEKYSNWALGFKIPLTNNPHGISTGLEIFGDFKGELNFLPGIYLPLGADNVLLKTGLEFNSSLEAIRGNITLMYIF